MEIELFSRKYLFPSITDNQFQSLQLQIAQTRKLYEEGSTERKAFFGLKKFPPRLSPEERLHLMEELVEHYQELIHLLKGKIEACREAFQEVGKGVREMFQEKIGQLQELEDRRQKLLSRLRAEGKQEVASTLELQQEQLRILAQNLARACLLIIRRLRHALEALSLLAEDEEAQKEVLRILRNDVDTYRSILEFNRDLKTLQRDISEITQTALKFDDLLTKSLGPLSLLIDEISKTDRRVAESLAEIQRISLELENQNQIMNEFNIGDHILDVLVASSLKQDVIDSLIESITSPSNSLNEVEFELKLAEGSEQGPSSFDFQVFSQNITAIVDKGLSDLYGEKPSGEVNPPLEEERQSEQAVPEQKIPLKYRTPVSRANPALVLFLLDMSGSMDETFRGLVTKAEYIARSVDRTVEELVVRCRKADGIRDYFHVGCLGFGDERVWSLLPLQAKILPISQLALSPRSIEQDAGGLPHPSWVLSKAEGNTPLRAAFREACLLVGEWCDRHYTSYPPTVILITDGRSSDGMPEEEARVLKQLHTSDGETLLCCLHIATESQGEILFPHEPPVRLDSNGKFLFQISSPMPFHIRQQALRLGYPIEEGSRFFIYGAGPERVSHFFDLGTRPAQLL